MDIMDIAIAKALSGGGGGGTGGGDVLCVTFSTEDGETWSADKTYAEVSAAIKAGVSVHAVAENATLGYTFYIQCVALMESQGGSGVAFEYSPASMPMAFGVVLLSNDTVMYQEINSGN